MTEILQYVAGVLGVAFWIVLIPYVYKRWRNKGDGYQTKTDELISKYQSRKDDDNLDD